MTDTTLDPKVLAEQIATQKAEEKMEELKSNLINSLAGKQPDTPPESWSALKNETVDIAVSKAEEKILAKIEEKQAKEQEEKKKAELEKIQVETQKKEVESQQTWQEMSTQWQEAVEDGLLPDIAPEVKTVIAEWQKGTGRAPTPEEFNDPGLKAYTEAKALVDKLRSEGKPASFYRTAQKMFNKQPAGATAPVLGASRAVPPKTGYDYDDIVAERKKMFRF